MLIVIDYKIMQGEDLVIANLGDSRAVLGTIGENGIMALQLTTDLKPCVPSKNFFHYVLPTLGTVLGFSFFSFFLALDYSYFS